MSNSLLEEDPYAWSLQTCKLCSLCSYCLLPSDNLLRCVGCKWMHYCNATCQKSDWQQHKPECRRMAGIGDVVDDEITKLSPDFPDDSLRIIARLVTRVQRKREVKKNGRGYGDLQSHMENMSISQQWRDMFKTFCTLFAYFVGDEKQSIHELILLEAFTKVKVNAFGIGAPSAQIGIGLYLSLSCLDHSCDPNGRIVFRGKRAVVVPTRECTFGSQPNLSQICHSYIENLNVKGERQKELNDQYCFECACTACCNSDWNDSMVALACQAEGCAGKLVPKEVSGCAPCSNCGLGAESSDLSTYRMCVELCDGVLKSLPAATHEQRLEMCEKSISVFKDVFHRFNIYALKIYRTAYEACVELKRWQDALDYGTLVLTIYNRYLGEFDPYLVAFCINFAKVHFNLGKVEDGRNIIMSVYKKFENIYGKNSKQLKDLDMLIDKTGAIQ